MAGSEELNRLRERLECGEFTPEQYEAEKRSLLEQSVARAKTVLAKTGEAARLKLTLVRGTVREIVFSGGAHKAALDVDGRKLELELWKDSIQIYRGDMVLLAGRAGGDPIQARIYYNETTGSGSIESSRKFCRMLLTAGWLGVLAGLSILVIVALAILRQQAFFSTAGIFQVLAYIVLIAVSAFVLALSIGLVCLEIMARKWLRLVQSVVSGWTRVQ